MEISQNFVAFSEYMNFKHSTKVYQLSSPKHRTCQTTLWVLCHFKEPTEKVLTLRIKYVTKLYAKITGIINNRVTLFLIADL